MKKSLFVLISVILIGTAIFAQENSEDATTTPEIPGIPGEIKLPMGILTIRGMALTGLRAKTVSQEGLTNLGQSADVSGNWRVDAINPVWGENRFDLHLDYSFLNYGVFLTTRFQSWAANSFDDNGYPDMRYAFVYAKFLDEKIKVSLGKLTDDIYAMPETKLWKTDGPWDMFNFSEDAKDNEHMSLRLEVKPMSELSIGAQYFFVRPDGTGMWDDHWSTNYADSGVWKEIGLAAEWKSDIFNAVAGVRFDSKGDPLNKYEGYTYLRGYYGNSDYLGSDAAPSAGPRYQYADEVIRPMTFPNAAQGDYTPAFGSDPGFDGAARAFMGFNVKAVKNMDIIGQAGFYNLPEWEKFGYARMNELVRYNNLGVKGFSLGLIMSQEFYGGDVFYTGESVFNTTTYQWDAVKMINAPFITFAPEAGYKLVDVPGFQLGATLTTTFGICQDVIDSYVKIKPNINLMLGALLVDLYYQFEGTDYTDKAFDRSNNPIKPETKHEVGLAVMLIF